MSECYGCQQPLRARHHKEKARDWGTYGVYFRDCYKKALARWNTEHPGEEPPIKKRVTAAQQYPDDVVMAEAAAAACGPKLPVKRLHQSPEPVYTPTEQLRAHVKKPRKHVLIDGDDECKSADESPPACAVAEACDQHFTMYGWRVFQPGGLRSELAEKVIRFMNDQVQHTGNEHLWQPIRHNARMCHLMGEWSRSTKASAEKLVREIGIDCRFLLIQTIGEDKTNSLDLLNIQLLVFDPHAPDQPVHIDQPEVAPSLEAYSLIIPCTKSMHTALNLHPTSETNELLVGKLVPRDLNTLSILQPTSENYKSEMVEPGSAVVFRQNVPHYGKANESESERYAIYAMYGPKRVREYDKNQRYPFGKQPIYLSRDHPNQAERGCIPYIDTPAYRTAQAVRAALETEARLHSTETHALQSQENDSSSSAAAWSSFSAAAAASAARTLAALPYRELKPFDELTRQGQIYILDRVFSYASAWGVSREQLAAHSSGVSSVDLLRFPQSTREEMRLVHKIKELMPCENTIRKRKRALAETHSTETAIYRPAAAPSIAFITDPLRFAVPSPAPHPGLLSVVIVVMILLRSVLHISMRRRRKHLLPSLQVIVTMTERHWKCSASCASTVTVSHTLAYGLHYSQSSMLILSPPISTVTGTISAQCWVLKVPQPATPASCAWSGRVSGLPPARRVSTTPARSTRHTHAHTHPYSSYALLTSYPSHSTCSSASAIRSSATSVRISLWKRSTMLAARR